MAPLAKNHNGAPASLSKEELHQVWTQLKDDVRRSYPIDRALTESTNVSLKGRGDIREACCPFHMEKTPSFNVIVSKGIYRCFGAGCGAHGDVFSLLQDVYGLSFRDAILLGAERAGITVPDVCRGASTKKTKSLAKTKMDLAVRFPENAVKAVPDTLAPSSIIPVPRAVSLPQENRWVTLWDDAERSRDPRPRVRRFLPEMVHLYRDIDQNPLCAILRIQHPEKGKFFIPARLGVPKENCPDGLRLSHPDLPVGAAWMVLGPNAGEVKPVYGMEDAREWAKKADRKILIVEGEKTRDATRRLLDQQDPDRNWLVLSPMGGGNSSIYADWAPLMKVLAEGDQRRIEVHVWPDADSKLVRPDGSSVDRQETWCLQTLSAFAQSAIDAGISMETLKMSRVLPPQSVVSGWDLADAEKDGWSAERVLVWLENSSEKLGEDKMTIRKTSAAEQRDPVASEESLSPFEIAEPQFDGQDAIDAEFADLLGDEIGDDTPDAEFSEKASDITPATIRAEDAVSDIKDVTGGGTPPEEAIRDNPYFRCLGYVSNTHYFMSVRSGQIFEISPNHMKSTYLLHLAPKSWWLRHYPQAAARQGAGHSVNWEDAVGDVIAASYEAGVWLPEREVGQGARLDGGRVVFNTGNLLYVDGEGLCPPHEFRGRYQYTIGQPCRTPDFANPFPANAPEIRGLLEIIRSLNWRAEHRELSILALFGWIGISPICGLLSWRPHLWLDGPRGAGKSWIINNILSPVFGDYAFVVKGNSTESGLRNMLHGKSTPLIFDEAEGEETENRNRMNAIIKLARYSATEDRSVVAQGVQGGGGNKQYAIASTFLLCSITPQIEASADITRFARAHLAGGDNQMVFADKIERPARELLTPEFSDRMIARVVMNAKNYPKIYRHLVEALVEIGLERRLADVFGSLATGAWMLLRDDIPEDRYVAMAFLGDEFNIIQQIRSFGTEISEDKDHTRVFQILMSHQIRFESRQMGVRTERIGALLEVACGKPGDGDCVISEDEARAILQDHGIRPSLNNKPTKPGEIADGVLIHRKAPPLKTIFEKTPYNKAYADVMHQADDVKAVEPVRFGPSLSYSRPIMVPLKHFSIEDPQG